MHPSFDPSASLRIWAVEAVVGGRLLRIPPLSAAHWLPPVMTGNLFAIRELMPGLHLADLLEEGAKLDEVTEAFTQLLEAASGRSQHATFLLACSAHERWDVVGPDLIRAGVRFTDISLGAALDAIYGTLLRSMDEKTQPGFIQSLLEPVEPTPIQPPRGAKPLPASALQYVQKRPKTVLRRPPDHEGVQNVLPTTRPQTRGGNGPAPRSGPRWRDAGGGNPPTG